MSSRATTQLARSLTLLLLLALAVLALGHLLEASFATLAVGSFADTPIFVNSTLEFLNTGHLYYIEEPMAYTYAPTNAIFKFPPLYALPFLPWLDAGQPVPDGLYELFFHWHLARYLGTLALCGWCLGPRRDPRWWCVVVIVFGFASPYYEALHGLTIDTLILLVLVTCLAVLGTRAAPLAGALLVVVGTAKLYPAIQALGLLASRSLPGILLASVATLLLVFAATLLAFGSANHAVYYGEILPVLLQEEVCPYTSNMSLVGHWSLDSGLPKTVFALPILLATLGVTAWSVPRIRRLPAGTARTGLERLLFVFVTPTMLLLLGNYWGNYQIVLVPGVLVLLAGLFEPGCPDRLVRLGIVAAVFLPLTASMNYSILHLPYVDALMQHQMHHYARALALRHVSPLLFWAGCAALLLAAVRRSEKKGQPMVAQADPH